MVQVQPKGVGRARPLSKSTEAIWRADIVNESPVVLALKCLLDGEAYVSAMRGQGTIRAGPATGSAICRASVDADLGHRALRNECSYTQAGVGGVGRIVVMMCRGSEASGGEAALNLACRCPLVR